MAKRANHRFSGPVTIFHERRLPEQGTPAGYAALIDAWRLVFRTPALDDFIALDLADRARKLAAEVPADLLARTAAFLLLKDSRASYVIEGEDPPHDRVQRWGRAIGQAGRKPLDLHELLRLQQIVIGDSRFVRLA